MCGESARTRSCSSRAGRCGSSRRSRGGDLRGVGGLADLRHRREAARSPPSRERACERLEPDRERALVDRARHRRRGRRRTRSSAATGPGVELLDEQHRRDGALGLAGHERALDRRGAAPARERRGVQVDERQRVEQRARHEQAVGDDARRPRRRAAAAAAARRPRARAARARARAPGPRRRRAAARLAAAARGPVGLAEHERDLESRAPRPGARAPARPTSSCLRSRRGRPPQCAQRRGPGCGRRAASASRRASGVVRSMISTPSRWSISCCRMRASRPSASTRTGSPFSSWRLHGHAHVALDGHAQRAEREAALLVARRLVRALDDLAG